MTGRVKPPTDIAELRARIEARGYRVYQRRGKHTRVDRPNGSRLMTLPLTPSDRRSILNAWREFLHRSVEKDTRGARPVDRAS